MLEELQTLALVGLLVSTYYLTIGCRQIGESMPLESTNISDKVAGATEVLDDIANLLNEGLQTMGGGTFAQTPSSPIQSILSALISSATSNGEHGTKPEIWEVHEDHPQTTKQTED